MRAHRYSPGAFLKSRDGFWDFLEKAIGNSVVLYLEFGVWRGESLRGIAKRLHNPNSLLHGFDSFEGLPERWNSEPVGKFSLGGAIPQIEDKRVTLHKGWFQETVPEFEFPSHEVLVINFDADLYSSTAYVLNWVRNRLAPGSYLYFDEFCDRNHEFRAFDEFLESTKMRFTLLAATSTFEHVLFQVC